MKACVVCECLNTYLFPSNAGRMLFVALCFEVIYGQITSSFITNGKFPFSSLTFFFPLLHRLPLNCCSTCRECRSVSMCSESYLSVKESLECNIIQFQCTSRMNVCNLQTVEKCVIVVALTISVFRFYILFFPLSLALFLCSYL